MILVVDDEFEFRQCIAELIREEGFEVREVSNGQEALDSLRSQSEQLPGLIILDMMMPVKDGKAFRKEQLSDAKLASIPVMIMTAGTLSAQTVAELNPKVFIKKPIDLEDFLQSVKELCPL